VPGKAAWLHLRGESGPARLRKDTRSGSVLQEKLLLLHCPNASPPPSQVEPDIWDEGTARLKGAKQLEMLVFALDFDW